MSWCRWSSTIDKKTSSDLYIYEDVYGGVTVMVAGRKRHAIVPDAEIPELPPEMTKENIDGWLNKYNEIMDWWGERYEGKHWEWRPVCDKWAGKNMNFTDMQEMKKTLDEMRADGVIFPEILYEYIADYKDTQS